MIIYTIGHSSLSQELFLHMLQKADIRQVVDVRSMPGSRKFPDFSQTYMTQWLAQNQLTYHHLSALGGRRPSSEDIGLSLNDGWQNNSFHNYADYTLTSNFQNGITQLENIARRERTVYFCAESHPSRCHRLIISNWLSANGWEIQHIINHHQKVTFIPHELGRWGAMPIIEKDGTVVYPAQINRQ